METIVACRTCGLAQRVEPLRPGTAAECSRCGSLLHERKVDSLARTAAFSLAALIFYVPANIYPILHMERYGLHSENTVYDGCVLLFQDGQYVVATIVFLASILIPLCKLLGLFFLCVTARFRIAGTQWERTWIYRIIRVIGPWAMLDVFLLAVLVALVKLEPIAVVRAGPGLFAFALVVVLTILASASFDPQLIWEERGEVS